MATYKYKDQISDQILSHQVFFLYFGNLLFIANKPYSARIKQFKLQISKFKSLFFFFEIFCKFHPTSPIVERHIKKRVLINKNTWQGRGMKIKSMK